MFTSVNEAFASCEDPGESHAWPFLPAVHNNLLKLTSCDHGAPQGWRKRPDFIFLLETHLVILEVDKNYHRFYSISCETARIGQVTDQVKLPIMLI